MLSELEFEDDDGFLKIMDALASACNFGAFGLSFRDGFKKLQNAHLNAEYSYSSCNAIPKKKTD